ncbi:DNA topoisomerase 1-like [Sinocyclocheilus grahami]|uniref:DNA topoisomerase 1-like n=1 Tax=Sinocyclocheilus grahami TaxID=75366 RepID=UPI0007AD57F3|nr:PREDICTED: DNA topoisomerase 1-like [Sinocyclocheilus grahami]
MDNSDRSSQMNVKEDPGEGPDFVTKGKGKKRKRKADNTDGPSSTSEAPMPKKKKKKVAEEGQGNSTTANKKKNKEKKRKEEGGCSVSTKKKKTKEEIEAARALKIKKKEEEEKQRWRWWEEEKYEDGIKLKFLEHKGPYFPPEYQPLPDDVKFYYTYSDIIKIYPAQGKPEKLSLPAEQVALFFAQMLDHEYTTKEVFRNNFFRDWRKVFKNLKLFMENKQEGDDLFDRFDCRTDRHVQHASSVLPSACHQTAVRVLNISSARANRAVAILYNYQRAPPKTFEQSLANLQTKIDSRKDQLHLAKKELKQAKKEAKGSSDNKLLMVVEKKKKAVQRCEEQLLKMEVQATDREENEQIALSTSKLNCLDPRISVAWCKNMEVPLDKIYNKTLRDKFAWAIDMTEHDFVFSVWFVYLPIYPSILYKCTF